MGRELGLQYRESTELTDEFTPLRRFVRQRLDDGWFAEAELVVRGGKAEIVAIHISHTAADEAPSGGLRKRLLDAVHLRAIREYGHHCAKLAAQAPIAVLPETSYNFLDRPARPGPPAWKPNVEDARLAQMYLAEIKAGGPRGVHKRLAKTAGPEFGARYFQKRIERLRGSMLTRPASPGIAGGELTDCAKLLLGLKQPGESEPRAPAVLDAIQSGRRIVEQSPDLDG